jgi:adenylylsulfate kinase
LATGLVSALVADDVAVEHLDGDVLRRVVSPELGFSEADRHLQGLRAGYIAGLLARHGVVVVLSLVAPLERTRRAMAASVPGDLYIVHVNASRKTRLARDTNGVYAACVERGDVDFVDVEAVWEPPADAALTMATDAVAVDVCVDRIAELIPRGG